MGRGGKLTRSEASRCWWVVFSLAMAFSVNCGAGQITYTYDALGRLTVVQYGSGAQATYAFDAVGNRTHVTSGSVPLISAFTAAAASASQINLSWSATDPQGPGIASYKLSRNNSQIASLPSGTTSYSDTGLGAGTTYTYVLTVQDSAGESANATQTGSTYNLPVISAFSAAAASASSMTLSWTASDPGGPGGLTYSVARGSTALGCTTSPCTDTGLAAGTQYTYTLTAIDGAGDRSTASTSHFTVPSAPGTPAVSSITQTSATATWTAASGTLTNYEYSLNGGASWTSTGAALSASLTGLSSGTTYTILVNAVNAGGAGPSSSAAFTTIYVDYPVMTAGNNESGSEGFNVTRGFGSMSPTTTSNGYTYNSFADLAPVGSGKYNETTFVVTGFASDPGQGWLVSAGVDGNTETGASASNYVFASGKASWVWTNGPDLPASGTYTCTIIHH